MKSQRAQTGKTVNSCARKASGGSGSSSSSWFPKDPITLENHKRIQQYDENGACLRSVLIGNRFFVSIVQCDITKFQTDVIVNAANTLSFMPMDNGVSGALRRACAPAEVTKQKKIIFEDDGTQKADVKVPTTSAGVQPLPTGAGCCGLRDRGVSYVVHAVGPIWSEFPIGELAFKQVPIKIKRTVKRTLNTCARIGGVRSVVLPPISGGIFTHWKEGTDIKEQEQLAARYAVLESTFKWCMDQVKVMMTKTPTPSSALDGETHHSSTASTTPPTAGTTSAAVRPMGSGITLSLEPSQSSGVGGPKASNGRTPLPRSGGAPSSAKSGKKGATAGPIIVPLAPCPPPGEMVHIDICDLNTHGLVVAFDDLVQSMNVVAATTGPLADPTDSSIRSRPLHNSSGAQSSTPLVVGEEGSDEGIKKQPLSEEEADLL